MLFYIMFFSFVPTLGIIYMLFAAYYIADYLAPILKAVLIGGAAIILIPRLLSAAPAIIFLAALVILAKGVKHIVGSLLG